jgi:hypothetical protein
MYTLPTTAIVPLFTDRYAAIRVRDNRVPLDTIATVFRAGVCIRICGSSADGPPQSGAPNI